MGSNLILFNTVTSWPAWDTRAFSWINTHHTPGLDEVMVFASGKWEWIPLYAFLAYMLFRRFGLRGFWLLVLAALCVTLTDQLSVHLFKDVFQRPRPCHEPELASLVRLWNNRCGGAYGFVSSHAANVFGMGLYLSLLFHRKWMSVLLLSWATLVSYSRVYLGVHYPLDVISGGILGAGVGVAVYTLARELPYIFCSEKRSDVIA